jgi:multiple sugar transport system substrate-binding protein
VGEKYVMPDGSEVDWDWTTFIQVSKLLTIDKNGNDATSPDFDATAITQYGYNPQWQDLRVNTSWYGGQEWFKDGKVAFPESAVAAINDKFDGMWGDEPWLPTGTAAASNELMQGNVFNSGKAAMAITMAWYTCCVSDLVAAGGTFDFGALPSYNGQVYGRVDADTYRILKTSKHPKEALDVVIYLVKDAVVKLSKTYGGVPGVTSEQAAWLQAKQEQFPFVKNWDTLMAGLDYPDVPSAEGYIPNGIEFKARYETFRNLIETDGTVDLAAELATLEADLQVIADKK